MYFQTPGETKKKHNGVLDIQTTPILKQPSVWLPRKGRKWKLKSHIFYCLLPRNRKTELYSPNNQQHNRTDYSAFQHKVPAAHLLLSPDTFPATKQKPPKKAQNRNSYKNPMQEEAKQETVDRTLPTNGVKGKSEQTHIKKEPKKFRNLLGKIQRRNKRKEQPPKNWKKKNYPKKWKKKKKK